MKKLEDLLNLPPSEDEAGPEDVTQPNPNLPQAINAVTVAEKIDHALRVVNDIDAHDKEMDEIAEEALESYKELLEYGMNSSDAHAGKILEVASQMLKTAMEARVNKVNRRLKTVDLQLKKHRIDRTAQSDGEGSAPSVSGSFDRNKLLESLAKNPSSTDK